MTTHAIVHKKLLMSLIATILMLGVMIAILTLPSTICQEEYATIGDLIEAINQSRLNPEVFYSDPE